MIATKTSDIQAKRNALFDEYLKKCTALALETQQKQAALDAEYHAQCAALNKENAL
jgi:hypothetical protein